MGLGLPLVKKATESLNGKVQIESNPVEAPGTKISIVFNKYSLEERDVPVINSLEGQSLIYGIENINIADPPYHPNRQSILLIEDNKAMLHFLSKKLSFKYNIFSALNGVEALE